MMISVRSFVASLALAPILLCVFGQPAVAQSSQHNQSDLEYIKRLSGYADQLQQRLDRLAPRVAALDPSGRPMTHAGQNESGIQMSGSPAPGVRVGAGHSMGGGGIDPGMTGEQRRRDTVMSAHTYDRLQREFDELKMRVRSEQRLIKKGDFESAESIQDEQKRLQRLERRIAELEREVVAAR